MIHPPKEKTPQYSWLNLIASMISTEVISPFVEWNHEAISPLNRLLLAIFHILVP